MFLGVILALVISYFMAALNPAIIISKKVLKQDIRNLGSKNAGTTNSIRTMGKKWGAVVFILDILKVVISYLLVLLLFKIFNLQFTDTAKSFVLFGSVLGHVYPAYYNFKGGKGVAVFLTSALLIDYKASLVCIFVGIILIAVTRWVSLGSICGSILLVIISLFMDTGFNTIILALAVLLIVYKHKSNIQKIIAGKENKLF